ncbi:MAG: hypothetical protein ACYDA4_11195 [Ignavibacteriaceae bacterium]
MILFFIINYKEFDKSNSYSNLLSNACLRVDCLNDSALARLSSIVLTRLSSFELKASCSA